MISKRYSIVVSGYYGFHNLGDDAILEMICKDLSKDYDLTVLSRDPLETSKKYCVRAVNRYDLRKIIKVITNADLLVSGGGTLLQDKSSVHSLLYYLLILIIAQHYSVPTMIYAAGIGPVIHSFSKSAAAYVLSRVDIISLRDRRSQQIVQKLCTEKKTFLTADPVLQIKASSETAVDTFFIQNELTDKKCFAVSLRKMDRKKLLQMSRLIERTASISGCVPVFICMQESEDLSVTMEVRQYMSETQSYLLDKRVSGTEMTAILQRMQCVIGLRLHALILGAAAGIHLIGFDYDPKISSFLEELQTERIFSMNDIANEETAESIAGIMSEPCKYDLMKLKERSMKTKNLVHEYFGQRSSADK